MIRLRAPLPGSFTIAFDVNRMRPGCILIQASMGATIPRDLFQQLFPAETWVVDGLASIHIFRATLDEIKIVARRARGEPETVFVFDEAAE